MKSGLGVVLCTFPKLWRMSAIMAQVSADASQKPMR
jgi:hypothetical protein